MQKTKMKGPPETPPTIHGKLARWVGLCDIECNMGVADDELSLHFGDSDDHVMEASYVKHGLTPTYIELRSGVPIMVHGAALSVAAQLVDSAVKRGTMRPDVAIIDPLAKTWRITGQ